VERPQVVGLGWAGLGTLHRQQGELGQGCGCGPAGQSRAKQSSVPTTATNSPPARLPARLPACPARLPYCRYKIEQELGTEIKPIPPVIEKGLYCA
jgi:hypothetical protein